MSEGIPLWSPQLFAAPASAAHARFQVRADAATIADAVEQIVAAGGYTDFQMDDARERLRFRTPRSIWNWEMDVGITTTPMRRGSDVQIAIDVAPDRPFGAHDGEKNEAAIAQIQRQIEAAVG
jgi:hypothetical protein